MGAREGDINSEATVEVGGEQLTLLPEKAGWLAASRTLLIADAHFGKAVSFRSFGVPVPRGTTTGMLDLLSSLIAAHDARRVVFLGDFLHSSRSHAAATLAALARWRAAHAAIELTLVRGNHDDRAGDPPTSLGMDIVDEPLRHEGLAFSHHPRPRPGHYVLCGHLHPCVSLEDGAFGRLRLPCFHFTESVGVLPAFGSFTGMHPIECGDADKVFAIAGDRVMKLPCRR